MAKYIFKKVLTAVVTVFVLASLTFFLMKAIPGDPFISDKVPQNVQEIQRAYYGLDKSIPEQYVNYLSNLLQGDFGMSMKKTGKSVISIIGETFPVSAKLGLTALFFAECIGILFGILCAHFRNRYPDYILMVVSVVGIAFPSVVLGPLVRYFFGVKLAFLPVTGWGSLQHIIMPTFVLGLSTVATTTRNMRASMLGVLTQDYVKTAKSKGISPKRIVVKHEVRNALVPIVTSLGVQIASILIGSFVVESIFLVPGLGKYFVDSITTMDYPMIMGTTIFYGVILVTLNMLVDVVYGLIDPRIRVK